jgi:thioredoxin reductase (NADPH)
LEQQSLSTGNAEFWFVYVVPIVVIVVGYVLFQRRRDRQNVNILQDSVSAGLTQPASLYPVINRSLCVGCNACVEACPEHDVLGLINRKAHLISPTDCIGHGACQTACPMNAISLVFGTAERGIELPMLKPNFETNVPGVFIAGELGGMGLIRNAIEQGCQAVAAIIDVKQSLPQAPSDAHDLVIVGAGPAGFAASLAAKAAGLNCVTLEQESLGGTVAHYPRGKIVMTAPVDLPLVGKMYFRETSKEELVAFFEQAERRVGLNIEYGEKVTRISSNHEGVAITTVGGTYHARAVLLAIGRRGTPRKLNIPGDEQSKVVYRLIDPQQYQHQAVTVVGGGDSALEAAAALAKEPGTQVTLSYRGDVFGRAKAKNRNAVMAAGEAGKIDIRLKSDLREIGADYVAFGQDGGEVHVPNDVVIVCAGGILPTEFLRSAGIEIETKYGTA